MKIPASQMSMLMLTELPAVASEALRVVSQWKHVLLVTDVPTIYRKKKQSSMFEETFVEA